MKNNKIIRIAQIMGYMNGAGVESVVMNYYNHIDKSKIQFDFICIDGSTNIPYEKIESQGGRVFIIPSYKKLFSYQKALKKIFTENEYKIVHSHVNTLSIFPLRIAKKCKIPVRIAHSHSTSNKKEWKRNIIKNILKPFSKIYATDYMCCSQLAGRWLFGNKIYDEGKVYLLNNAIDVEKFQYSEKIRDKKRKDLEINPDTLVIGHIGRFMPQKNHAFLIDVFNEIHKKNNNSILLLAGQGPLINDIKEKVKKLKLNNSVKFLGQREDVSDLYQIFDVFCLTSLYEGLPVVGVEAQVAGLLCIFSNDMTKETKILQTTQFLSLNQSALQWSDMILDEFSKFNRKNTIKEISDSGFNIKEEVKKLEQKYLSYK